MNHRIMVRSDIPAIAYFDNEHSLTPWTKAQHTKTFDTLQVQGLMTSAENSTLDILGFAYYHYQNDQGMVIDKITAPNSIVYGCLIDRVTERMTSATGAYVRVLVDERNFKACKTLTRKGFELIRHHVDTYEFKYRDQQEVTLELEDRELWRAR